MESGEQCDDGNVINGDGCSSTCQLECPVVTMAANPVYYAWYPSSTYYYQITTSYAGKSIPGGTFAASCPAGASCDFEAWNNFTSVWYSVGSNPYQGFAGNQIALRLKITTGATLNQDIYAIPVTFTAAAPAGCSGPITKTLTVYGDGNSGSRAAQCMGISSPDTVASNSTFNVAVTMKNTGTMAWLDHNPYESSKVFKLGEGDGTSAGTGWNWGRALLPVSKVDPGSQVTFNFTATAPAATGSKLFRATMLQELVTWFGASCNKTISVGICSPASTRACGSGACLGTQTCASDGNSWGACSSSGSVCAGPTTSYPGVCANEGTVSAAYCGNDGACGSPVVTPVTRNTNGTLCDDNNACTQTDTCQSGVCTGSSPVACTASGPCKNAGSCQPATGACSAETNKPDGTACPGGLCASGACQSPPAAPGSPGGYNSKSSPAAPGGNPACGNVKITWTDNSSDETGFIIYRDGSQIGTSGPLAGAGQTGSFTAPIPDTSPHAYGVASTKGGGNNSAIIPISQGTLAGFNCEADLSPSDKDIIGVGSRTFASNSCSGGTDPLPAPVLNSIRQGDRLTFAVNLCNGGSADAANVTVIDTFVNLQPPAGGAGSNPLNASYNGESLKLAAGSSPNPGEYAITGSAPNQAVTFNLTAARYNIPKYASSNGIRTLVFSAAPFSASPNPAFPTFQNRARVTYIKAGATQDSYSFYTPLIPFATSQGAPTIIEIP